MKLAGVVTVVFHVCLGVWLWQQPKTMRHDSPRLEHRERRHFKYLVQPPKDPSATPKLPADPMPPRKPTPPRIASILT